MRIELWAVGKLKQRDLEPIILQYLRRIRQYQPVNLEEITVKAKSTQAAVLQKAEAEKILGRLSDGDYLILMDEAGQKLTSEEFAGFLQNCLMQSASKIVFLIGGAYGFDAAVYERAQRRISLSSMTFPHDLARLITVEQLYRAFSILHNSPYHH